MVNVTKKPIFVVEDVGKTLTMPGRSIVLPVGSEDPAELELTAGRIRSLTATG